tara:strand:+ start:435417 stop:435659 length:243 start_codon:yes stop_codon:yes gene_type:complete
MVVWVSLGLFIGLMTAFFTLIWWKVGDQWADEEYKKFGHGGGAPKGPPPKVISNFEDEPAVVKSATSSESVFADSSMDKG